MGGPHPRDRGQGGVRAQASADGRVRPLARLAPLPAVPAYGAGPTARPPERGGLAARSAEFPLEPARVKGPRDRS